MCSSDLDLQALKRIEWTYGIRLTPAETPTREETLKMLADRRIREFKERLDAGAVIPEEFVMIAKEILTDPEAEGLVSLLVDNFLSGPPTTSNGSSEANGDDPGPAQEPRSRPQSDGGRPGGGRGRGRGPRRSGGRG